MRKALYPERDPNDNSYASGFFAVLPLPGVTALEDVGVFMHLDLQDGRQERHLVDLFKALPAAEIASASGPPDCSVAICMATHDPPYELFARQIESIAQQSHSDWRCIISDDRSPPHVFDRMRRLLDGDGRFLLDRSELRLGAYHNFERALTRVSKGTRYVALADQDDRWYPEKLERLLGAFKHDTALAYSDCRITAADGRVLSETFFARRRNNTSDLRKMLLANTVTGASSIFQRELLDDALPFPPIVDPRVCYHDHWLAVVALAAGRVEYLDTALYDYVQHGENAVGHAVINLEERSYQGPWLVRSRQSYELKLIRTVLLASALAERLDGRLTGARARQVRQLSALERSPVAAAKLAWHAIGSSPSRSPTEGAERELASALLWRRRLSHSARRRDRLAHPWYATAPEITTGPLPAGELRGVRALGSVTAPLRLEVDERQQPRINFLMRRLELDDVIDNDRGKLALAASLGAAGFTCRIVAFGDGRFALSGAGIELLSANGTVPVSPADVFVATDWLTAYAAHLAAARLCAGRFVYVIDEYAGDVTPDAPADAAASYALPHCAVFWDKRLENYFRSHRLGVFGADAQPGTHASISPAITAVESPTADELARRGPSRVLMHAPESGAFGLFEAGVAALARVADDGALSGWEVNAIGTQVESVIRLAPKLDLVPVGAATAEDYAALLRAHDVGISLCPGLRLASVATEMAAAGLPTITLCLDGDDQRWLTARSENFIAVEPTTGNLTRALQIAIARASAPDRRVRGSAIDQPTSWAETFGPGAIAQINSLITSCRQQG